MAMSMIPRTCFLSNVLGYCGGLGGWCRHSSRPEGDLAIKDIMPSMEEAAEMCKTA